MKWRHNYTHFVASTLATAVKFAPRPLYSQGEETLVPTEWEDGLAVKLVVPTGWRCVGRTAYSLEPGVKFRDRKSEAINHDSRHGKIGADQTQGMFVTASCIPQLEVQCLTREAMEV